MSEERFLSRWSRLKKDAREQSATVPVAPPPVAPPADAPAPGAVGDAQVAGDQAPAREEAQRPAALPDLESLTHESDFAPFMKGEVDPGTRRQALKTLFTNPQFNVMDGLDTYIDDYSKPDPLPQGWLEKMNQMAHLGHYLEPEEGREESAAQPAEDAEAPAAAAEPPAESGAPETPQPSDSSNGAPAAEPGEFPERK